MSTNLEPQVLYLRVDDVEAAIKHGAVIDCVIYSVDDPRDVLVPVQLLPGAPDDAIDKAESTRLARAALGLPPEEHQ